MRFLPLLVLSLLPICPSCVELPLRKLNAGACLAMRFNSSKSSVIVSLMHTVKKTPVQQLLFNWNVTGTPGSTLRYYADLKENPQEMADCKALSFDKDGFTNVYIKHDAAHNGWKMSNEENWHCPSLDDPQMVVGRGLTPDFFNLTIHNENGTHENLQTIAHCD